jgi:acyl-CoA thioesterase-1
MNVKFYLFGDSICFGQLVSHHLTWISSLSSRISEILGSESGVLIQNASINGNTTRQALERMSYDVTSHQPDVLLVQFGMNDCNFWQTDFGAPRVSQRSFESNLHEIIDRADAAGVKHIFLATNHPSTKGEFPHLVGLTHAESNKKYNAIIRKLACSLIDVKKSLTLIDNEKFWMSRIESQSGVRLDDLLLPDGIHLSEAGHRLYDEYAGSIICKYFETRFK